MNFKNLLVHYSLRRLKNLFFLSCANLPMPGHQIRPLFVKWGGVDLADTQGFIGGNVGFDTVHPEKIHIGKGAVITEGVIILTHYTNSKTGEWSSADVYIGDNVFIGARTIITKSLTIGNNSLIGTGSVVTKNIPANEVWAGNPARFIRKREISK